MEVVSSVKIPLRITRIASQCEQTSQANRSISEVCDLDNLSAVLYSNYDPRHELTESSNHERQRRRSRKKSHSFSFYPKGRSDRGLFTRSVRLGGDGAIKNFIALFCIHFSSH